jgi:hypothetical protein
MQCNLVYTLVEGPRRLVQRIVITVHPSLDWSNATMATLPVGLGEYTPKKKLN